VYEHLSGKADGHRRHGSRASLFRTCFTPQAWCTFDLLECNSTIRAFLSPPKQVPGTYQELVRGDEAGGVSDLSSFARLPSTAFRCRLVQPRSSTLFSQFIRSPLFETSGRTRVVLQTHCATVFPPLSRARSVVAGIGGVVCAGVVSTLAPLGARRASRAKVRPRGSPLLLLVVTKAHLGIRRDTRCAALSFYLVSTVGQTVRQLTNSSSAHRHRNLDRVCVF